MRERSLSSHDSQLIVETTTIDGTRCRIVFSDYENGNYIERIQIESRTTHGSFDDANIVMDDFTVDALCNWAKDPQTKPTFSIRKCQTNVDLRDQCVATPKKIIRPRLEIVHQLNGGGNGHSFLLSGAFSPQIQGLDDLLKEQSEENSQSDKGKDHTKAKEQGKTENKPQENKKIATGSSFYQTHQPASDGNNGRQAHPPLNRQGGVIFSNDLRARACSGMYNLKRDRSTRVLSKCYQVAFGLSDDDIKAQASKENSKSDDMKEKELHDRKLRAQSERIAWIEEMRETIRLCHKFRFVKADMLKVVCNLSVLCDHVICSDILELFYKFKVRAETDTLDYLEYIAKIIPWCDFDSVIHVINHFMDVADRIAIPKKEKFTSKLINLLEAMMLSLLASPHKIKLPSSQYEESINEIVDKLARKFLLDPQESDYDQDRYMKAEEGLKKLVEDRGRNKTTTGKQIEGEKNNIFECESLEEFRKLPQIHKINLHWHYQYLFFKSALLSSKYEVAWDFAFSVLKYDCYSYFIWSIMCDTAAMTHHPLPEVSQCAFSIMKMLIAEDYMKRSSNGYAMCAVDCFDSMADRFKSQVSVDEMWKHATQVHTFSDLLEQKLSLHSEKPDIPHRFSHYAWIDSKADFILDREIIEKRLNLFSSQSSTYQNKSEIYVPPVLEELTASTNGGSAITNTAKDGKTDRNRDGFVKEFLSQEPRVLVILGQSGSGKSTFVQRIYEDYEESEQNEQEMGSEKKTFIYINLAAVKDPHKLESHIQQDGLLKTRWERRSSKVVFIMDGYDELQQAGSNIIESNWPLLREHHVIITYRHNMQETAQDLNKLFSPQRNQSQESRDCRYSVLKPFGEYQIRDYIKQWRSLNAGDDSDDTIYNQILSSGMKEQVASPFILSMLLTVYNEMKGSSSKLQLMRRYDVYDRFVNSYHTQKIKEVMKVTTFDGQYLSGFCENIAREMFVHQSTALRYEYSYSNSNDENAIVLDSFFGDTHELRQIRDMILIRGFGKTQSAQYFAFLHRSIQEFFIAKLIVKEIMLEKCPWESGDSLFCRLDSRDLEIRKFLADLAASNYDFRNRLINIVLSTKEKESSDAFAKAASEAITILNYARVPLHGQDFQKVRIPNADLDQAVLQDVDFTGADLRGVSLKDANIRGCKLDKAKMENLDFGQLPKILHPDRIFQCCNIIEPDQTYLYTSCENSVFVFDLESCSSLKTNISHPSRISCMISFTSGTAGFLVSGDTSGIVVISDAYQTNEIHRFVLKEGIQVTSMMAIQSRKNLLGSTSSPTTSFYLICSSMDGRVNLYDFTQSEVGGVECNLIQELIIMDGYGINRPVVSMCAYTEGGSYHVMVAIENKLNVYKLQINPDSVSLVEIRALPLDGENISVVQSIRYKERHKIAVGSKRSILIYDTQSMDARPQKMTRDDGKDVDDLKWVPPHIGEDPKFIVATYRDRGLVMWSVEESQIVRIFQGHSKPIAKLSVFSFKQENYVMGTCDDKNAWIWSLFAGEQLKKASGHRKAVNALDVYVEDSDPNVASGPSGSTASGSEDRNWVENLLQRKGVVVTGSSDNSIKVWDYATGICRATLPQSEMVPMLVLTKLQNGDFRVYYRLGKEKSIYFLDPFASEPDGYEHLPNDPISLGGQPTHFRIFEARSKRYLATACASGQFEIFDAMTHKSVFQLDLEAYSFSIFPSTSNPNRFIVVCASDYQASCFYLDIGENGEFSNTEPISLDAANGYTEATAPLLINSAGQKYQFMSSERNGATFKFTFDLSDGGEEPSEEELVVLDDPVFCSALVEVDGLKYYAFGDQNGCIRIHKIDEAFSEVYVEKHHNQVRSLIYRAHDRTLVSTGEDGTMCLWIVSKQANSDKLKLRLAWTTSFALDGKGCTSEDAEVMKYADRYLIDQFNVSANQN
eukprot:TRINITY_DN117_c0_g2_i1.p1 TRINITY_DN117_c0_g2~~TRINITY_DN117_c0_g2_i1.p1  ORF type:complete len:1908 (+),score=350.86 TRINITY_DN117_c0_g2_i1:127-5850(+)